MKLLFILLLLGGNVLGQLIPHGTLTAAIICKDGILLAVDSRVTFTNPVDSTVMYRHDNENKVFYYQGLPLLFSGKGLIGNKNVREILSTANIIVKESDSIKSKLDFLNKYIFNLHSKAFNSKNYATFFIGGFYTDTVPYVFKSTKDSVMYGTSQASSDPNFYNIVPSDSYDLPASFLISKIDSLFNVFVKKYKLENKVGGPVSLIKITPGNQIHWIKNDIRHIESSKERELKIIKNKTDGFKRIGYSRRKSMKMIKKGLKLQIRN